MIYLKRNLPHWERGARLGFGVLLAWLVWTQPLGAVLFWLGWASVATLVLTAFVGFCPACAMLGRRALNGAS